jgi:hypothetical protein
VVGVTPVAAETPPDPPNTHEVIRVPVDEEGRETELYPA